MPAHASAPADASRASATAMPAVLVHGRAPSSLRVASLTPLERLLVAVHRAGCWPIHIVGPESAEPALQFRRASALGITYSASETMPQVTGPVFVAEDTVLLTAAGVRALVDNRGRLAWQGCPQPAGVVSKLTDTWQDDLSVAPIVETPGVVAAVTDAPSARAASRRFWASLTSASDGFVDRHFNRPVGRLLSKALVWTAVTPNQISVLATIIGVIAAFCFGTGTWVSAILGAVLLQISAVIDCVDGDVARAVFKESPLGKWLDIVGDQIVHISVFVAIGIGLWRAGMDGPVLVLAMSAGLGVVLSFGVLVRSLLHGPTDANSALQKLIDATTNRDFSVLLLALALADRLVWFLWMAAFGVHVFWILAFSLQLSRRAPASA